MKRTKKIGIAATSLAAAMTLFAPGVASANELCKYPCDGGNVLTPVDKVEIAQERVFTVTKPEFIKYDPFVKVGWGFLKVEF